MATWDDVHRLARALPQTAEDSSRGGLLAWSVKYKRFSSELPLRRGDLQALGDAAPQGPVLAARVPDLGTEAPRPQSLDSDSPMGPREVA